MVAVNSILTDKPSHSEILNYMTECDGLSVGIENWAPRFAQNNERNTH